MNIFNIDNLQQLEALWAGFAEIVEIPIDHIETGMQMRVDGTDQTRVASYAQLIENGVEFPPLDVFQLEYSDGEVYELVNGYHRIGAYKLAGHETVTVRLFQGRTVKEAEMFGAFANAANGKGATKEDISNAISVLLEQEGAYEKFVVKHKLDVASVAQWIGVTEKWVRELTKELRAHITFMRDATIEVLDDEGLSQRAISKEMGLSLGVVNKGVHKRNTSKNEHSEEPTDTRSPSQSIFDTLKSEKNSEAEDDVELPFEIHSEEEEALRDGSYAEKLAALDSINKQGFETLARNMKDKKEKRVITPVQRVINALAGLTVTLNTAEGFQHDLSDLRKAIHEDATALNDLTIVASHVNNLIK